MNVLLLDGDTKHSLAVTRSLGKRGVEVHAAAPSRLFNLAGYSRFCRKGIPCPPAEDAAPFLKAVSALVRGGKFEVMLPLKSVSSPLICRHRAEFEGHVRLALPSSRSMEIAADKRLTFQFLREKGFPIPSTFYFQSTEEIEAAAATLRYPVVVKKALGSGGIYFANSLPDLLEHFPALISRDSDQGKEIMPIVQEFIPGDGFGFFALFNRGAPRAIFMHHRLKEYPITGGPSVMAESCYDEKLKELGLAVLKSLDWHGVAMVEVKKDARDGSYKIMEINPKFWGSLDLAIAAGVDFPWLAYRMALDGDVKKVFDYRVGLKYRWLFPGEILRLLALPREAPAFFRDFFRGPCAYDIDWRDPLPHLLQIAQIFGYLIKSRGRFRYPWGRPRFTG
jgi:predicted ATP-grasp superfamily ATP-dependent carboligase